MLNKILNSSLFYTIVEIFVMCLGFYQIGYNNMNPIIAMALCTIIIFCLYEISGNEVCIGNPYKHAPVLKKLLFSYTHRLDETEEAYRFVNQATVFDDWSSAEETTIKDGTYEVVFVGRNAFALGISRATYVNGEWNITTKNNKVSNETHMVLCYSKQSFCELEKE